MDNLNDSLKALEDGEKILGNTLLVQVIVNFAPTHNGQPELGTISNWLSEHGFSFYRLNNLQHSNPSSEQAASVQQQRSEEHTSELQSLMRISYTVFGLKKKKKTTR